MYLTGNDMDGSNVTIRIKAGEEGDISIRGETRKICDHVLREIETVKQKMELMMV